MNDWETSRSELRKTFDQATAESFLTGLIVGVAFSMGIMVLLHYYFVFN